MFKKPRRDKKHSSHHQSSNIYLHDLYFKMKTKSKEELRKALNNEETHPEEMLEEKNNRRKSILNLHHLYVCADSLLSDIEKSPISREEKESISDHVKYLTINPCNDKAKLFIIKHLNQIKNENFTIKNRTTNGLKCVAGYSIIIIGFSFSTEILVSGVKIALVPGISAISILLGVCLIGSGIKGLFLPSSKLTRGMDRFLKSVEDCSSFE